MPPHLVGGLPHLPHFPHLVGGLPHSPHLPYQKGLLNFFCNYGRDK
ncbi:MAG: hypothetical protein F6J93_04385 [Oscillatoria sp. SIO1A7]|nr:hypothetical protein [Oscillatoria sp. SIO1A7]